MKGYLLTILLPLLLVFAPVSLEAQGRRAGSQEDRDSLVRLISADMARLVEVDGQQYRKVVGNAVFLHNGTYLRCDSAYWNVSGEYIDAKGHIRIERDTPDRRQHKVRYPFEYGQVQRTSGGTHRQGQQYFKDQLSGLQYKGQHGLLLPGRSDEGC